MERLGQRDTLKRSDRFQGKLTDLAHKVEPAWELASGPPKQGMLTDSAQKVVPAWELSSGPPKEAALELPILITKEQQWDPQPRLLNRDGGVHATHSQQGNALATTAAPAEGKASGITKTLAEGNQQTDDHESTTASSLASRQCSDVGDEENEWSFAPNLANVLGIWR